eukprot:1392174-Alexandrium_andersonii.AAC.1
MSGLFEFTLALLLDSIDSICYSVRSVLGVRVVEYLLARPGGAQLSLGKSVQRWSASPYGSRSCSPCRPPAL